MLLCMHTIEKERSRSLSLPSGQRYAFDVLMASSHDIVLPLPLTPTSIEERSAQRSANV